MRKLRHWGMAWPLLAPALALANAAIPGPFIWFAAAQTTNAWQWLLVCSAICVGVEAALYTKWQLFARPLAVSIWLNTISLLLGIPLSLASDFDPTWFVIPTLLSALSECFCAHLLPAWLRQPKNSPHLRTPPTPTHGRLYGLVGVANLCSNGIMMLYLYLLMHQALPMAL